MCPSPPGPQWGCLPSQEPCAGSWHGMRLLGCHQILRCVFIHCPTCMSKSECIAETLLVIRAIYIYSFCYLCALLCPWELCSSLPAFTHKYPQWDLQIYPSVENWCMILRAAMQHPNYTSYMAWEKKWASNIK